MTDDINLEHYIILAHIPLTNRHGDAPPLSWLIGADSDIITVTLESGHYKLKPKNEIQNNMPEPTI